MRRGILLNIVSLAYVAFLTVLLLTADPMHMIGSPEGLLRTVLAKLMPFAHLLSFFVLTVLVLVARWPLPRWFLVALLILYGTTTEITQFFLPPRMAEWDDWFQDITGVVTGVAVCWVGSILLTRLRAGKTAQSDRQ